MWQGGERRVELRSTGARIPIAIGGMADATQPIAVGWWVPRRSWFLTPEAHRSRGRFVGVSPNSRQTFKVSVTWLEDRAERLSESTFELRFWNNPESEPRFLRIGDRPTYRDQIGGLSEQHASGVALRNEGIAVDAVLAVSWRDRVNRWTDESLAIVNEASPDQAVFFRTLNNFEVVTFPNAIDRSDEHLLDLRVLHERLNRLQRFIRSGEI